MRPRERVIKIILRVLARPNTYTRRDLAKHFKVSKKTIDADVKEIEIAKIGWRQDFAHNTCSIIPDRTFKELEHLMPLSDMEQLTISTAIDRYVNSKEAQKLKRKFYSLYDFQRLGIQALRKPELEKLDLLEAAKKEKQQVILKNYRSNSNAIKDRLVEPFHIDSEQGMLQAFDVDAASPKHFKINRIERVDPIETPWAFEEKHAYKYTDVFRIANSDTISVHLELDVFAFNALVENYPKARADVRPGTRSGAYDFQTQVNRHFLGLTNFILGNRGHVKILSPDLLKEHILEEAQKIIDMIRAEEEGVP